MTFYPEHVGHCYEPLLTDTVNITVLLNAAPVRLDIRKGAHSSAVTVARWALV